MTQNQYIAFLVDLTSYLNDLNLKLQKQEQLVDLYSHLKAFQNKIRLRKAHMLSGNSYHFTLCIRILLILNMLKNSRYFRKNFRTDIAISKTWKTFNHSATSTKNVVQNTPLHLQMELIENQQNSVLKSKYAA